MRDTDRQIDRQAHRDRQIETETQKNRQTDRLTETDKQRETVGQKEYFHSANRVLYKAFGNAIIIR